MPNEKQVEKNEPEYNGLKGNVEQTEKPNTTWFWIVVAIVAIIVTLVIIF